MSEQQTPKLVQVLLIEDSGDDAYFVQAMLAEGGRGQFHLTHAPLISEAWELLKNRSFDVVLLDLALPGSTGLETFDQVRLMVPAVPVVVLTGSSDESMATKAIQKGAQDYLVKGQLTGLLLSRTLRHAIERGRLVRELQEALAEVRTLSGLLPICSSCKRVRDDSGYWNQIETFIAKHTTASFTHGVCPTCAIKQLEASGVPVPDHLRAAAAKGKGLFQ
jgi:CheY-like chemotaxis protein